MPGNIARIRLLALLLGIVFLAAQFHFCADLTSDPYSLHVCPFCTVAGSAILMPPPSIAIMPIVSRLERPAVVFDVSYAIPRATSSRAPPSA
jgi:hypothetical protein